MWSREEILIGPFQECPCKKIEGTVDEEMFDGFRGILAKPIESVID